MKFSRQLVAIVTLCCFSAAQIPSSPTSLTGITDGISPVTFISEDTRCSPQGTWIGPTMDGPAHLPIACVPTGTQYTPAPGQVWGPIHASSLVSTYNQMKCGDRLLIFMGETAPGVALGPKNCDNAHWIWIESTGVTDPAFPLEGIQINGCAKGLASMPGRLPYNCPNPKDLMVHFVAPSSGSALLFQGADHIRTIGIDFTRTSQGGALIYSLVDLTGGTQESNNLVFDRDMFSGIEPPNGFPQTVQTDTSTTRGLYLAQSNHIAVVHSAFYNIYDNGGMSSNGNTDSQCVGGGVGGKQNSGWGVYKFFDNHMECGSEGVILGGDAGPALHPAGCTQGVNCTLDVPTDIYIARNYFFTPAFWNCNTTIIVAFGCPNRKNGTEMKTGVRGLEEGNVFENCWESSQPYCYVIDFAPKNQQYTTTDPGRCPGCVVNDWTARDNYSYNWVGDLLGLYTSQIVGGCAGCGMTSGMNFSIHDNVFGDNLNLGNLPMGGADGIEFLASAGPIKSASIVHNTILAAIRSTLVAGAVTAGTGNSGIDGFIFKDNLAFSPNNANNGWHTYLTATGGGCDKTGMTMQQFLTACINGTTPTWTVTNNAFFFPGSISFVGWPAGNLTTASISTVGFTTVPPNNSRGFPDSGFNPSIYELLSTSPFHNAASDGKDIGADIPTLLSYINGVRK